MSSVCTKDGLPRRVGNGIERPWASSCRSPAWGQSRSGQPGLSAALGLSQKAPELQKNKMAALAGIMKTVSAVLPRAGSSPPPAPPGGPHRSLGPCGVCPTPEPLCGWWAPPGMSPFPRLRAGPEGRTHCASVPEGSLALTCGTCGDKPAVALMAWHCHSRPPAGAHRAEPPPTARTQEVRAGSWELGDPRDSPQWPREGQWSPEACSRGHRAASVDRSTCPQAQGAGLTRAQVRTTLHLLSGGPPGKWGWGAQDTAPGVQGTAPGAQGTDLKGQSPCKCRGGRPRTVGREPQSAVTAPELGGRLCRGQQAHRAQAEACRQLPRGRLALTRLPGVEEEAFISTAGAEVV